MPNLVWSGPPSAPWDRLVVDRLPPLTGGFPVQISAVLKGSRLVGDVVTAFPVLDYTELPALMGRDAATLTHERLHHREYQIVGEYETQYGILTELALHQPATIVHLHALNEDARAAGGGVVYLAPFPFRYSPEAVPTQPIGWTATLMVAGGAAMVGMVVGKAWRRK